MNKNIIIGIGVVVVIVAVLFVWSNKNTDTLIGDDANIVRTVQSDFDQLLKSSIVLADYDGNKVSLTDFKGKALVINSWAVWCPFCREELPDFAELQKEFGDKIIVIAIDRQEPLEKAKGYTDELGITSDMLFLLDLSDSFYKSIGGFSMPETIFINSSGEIVVHKRGPMDLDEMREHTNKILNTNSASL